MTHIFRAVRMGKPREFRDRSIAASPATAPGVSIQATKEGCQACTDWYQPLTDGHGRCNHPYRGCNRCETRVDPWTWPKACPVQAACRRSAIPVQTVSKPA